MSTARIFVLVSALAASAFGACTVETESEGPSGGPSTGGPSAGGASAGLVSSCKASCDKMKFFECSSAAEQARCYGDCDTAASASIEVFVGCAENSICDPDCRTSIQPAPAPGQPAGPPSGGGATTDSCALACDKAIQCSFLPLGAKAACAQECAGKAYQYQIDCVLNNACEQIRNVCGDLDIETGGDVGGGGNVGGGDGDGDGDSDGGGDVGGGDGGGDVGGGDSAAVAACQSSCDKLNFFACVDATEHAACRDLCASAPANDRDTFAACGFSGGAECEQLAGCFEAFRN